MYGEDGVQDMNSKINNQMINKNKSRKVTSKLYIQNIIENRNKIKITKSYSIIY